jgi:hypothetical protein
MWNVWGRGNVLARIFEGKKQLGRPGCRWVNNIKMDFLGIVWRVDWIVETQNKDRRCTFLSMLMSLGVLFLEKPRDCSFCSKTHGVIHYFRVSLGRGLNGVKSVMAIFCVIWPGDGMENFASFQQDLQKFRKLASLWSGLVSVLKSV